jgi:PAS domain S-box-containing protein
MDRPESPEQPSADAAAQVNDLFDSSELARALDRADFRHLLHHIPIAVMVSRLIGGEHRVAYANKAFESLLGHEGASLRGRDWSILGGFHHEDDSELSLSRAIVGAEDFIGTFCAETPKPISVEAYATVIQTESGDEHYHVTALVNVSERARAQREEFARQIRDKDLLLREIQHRVKNNLQLITTLIRLEARYEAKPNLERLAGRIEALQCLYQELSDRSLQQEVDLGHYISRIASAAMRTHGTENIRFHSKFDSAHVSINVAMPLGLVVNELLTNAFKHAFVGREIGAIILECLRVDDTRWQIVVADDGVGLGYGAKWPPEGKLSTLMVQTLRENADTDLRVDSTPGKGTRVAITMRIQPRRPQVASERV